jgi:hypothetical protein
MVHWRVTITSTLRGLEEKSMVAGNYFPWARFLAQGTPIAIGNLLYSSFSVL